MDAEEKTLERELKFFEEHKREWLQDHPADFVVISGASVAGIFQDYESAFKAGLSKFGLQASFLVKQIWAEEPVYLIH